MLVNQSIRPSTGAVSSDLAVTCAALTRVLSLLKGVKHTVGGNRPQYEALCPAHEDTRPSLSISVGDHGRVLLRCHAGCSVDQILRALDLEFKDLFDTAKNGAKSERRIVATYDYNDEEGKLLFQVVRYDPKDFRIRRPDGKGGWLWSLGETRLVLYRLPRVRQIAQEGKALFVCEGEKDVETLRRLGKVATTSPGGAGKWRPEYSQSLRGCSYVVILPHNDKPGREHGEQVAASLLEHGVPVKILTLPALPPKGDVSDWVKAGGTLEDLVRLQNDAPFFRQEQPTSSSERPGMPASVIEPPAWPDPVPPEGFHGLPGEFVRLVEPHTEADSAALLVQFLTAFGSAAGRSAHFQVEADRHFTNLFVALVGVTSKGRKGSSWGHVRRVMEGADEIWARNRILSGLSSGEGLLWALRDEIQKSEPIKDKGRVQSYEKIIVDSGIDDKRLLALEPELASTLRVLGREGNTLSPVIRQAWDTGNLQTLTKNSPAKATGALVSIIGHITRDELRRYLETTEAGNGFANRFLWICVRRSKALPEGGDLRSEELRPLIEGLKVSLAFARKVGRMTWEPSAREIWHRVYADLSEGKLGLFGAVTSRAEAQTMRLACLYALLDRSTAIRPEHLKAALAVWEYAEASARYIFGDVLGDPTGDAIIAALRQAANGLTRSQISSALGRNKGAREVDRALRMLFEHGLARSERIETEGRPAELWRPTVRSGPTEYEKNEKSPPRQRPNSFISYSRE